MFNIFKFFTNNKITENAVEADRYTTANPGVARDLIILSNSILPTVVLMFLLGWGNLRTIDSMDAVAITLNLAATAVVIVLAVWLGFSIRALRKKCRASCDAIPVIYKKWLFGQTSFLLLAFLMFIVKSLITYKIL